MSLSTLFQKPCDPAFGLLLYVDKKHIPLDPALHMPPDRSMLLSFLTTNNIFYQHKELPTITTINLM